MGNSEDVKPLAPYGKNSQEILFDEFIDYDSGKTMQRNSALIIDEIPINRINATRPSSAARFTSSLFN